MTQLNVLLNLAQVQVVPMFTLYEWRWIHYMCHNNYYSPGQSIPLLFGYWCCSQAILLRVVKYELSDSKHHFFPLTHAGVQYTILPDLQTDGQVFPLLQPNGPCRRSCQMFMYTRSRLSANHSHCIRLSGGCGHREYFCHGWYIYGRHFGILQ